MKRWRTLLQCLAATVLCVWLLDLPSHVVNAQSGVGGGGIVALQPIVSDPCESSSNTKNSVSISISTATTTQLVAPSGTTAVYPCLLVMGVTSGTTPTMVLEYGTGATCGVSTVVLTGTIALATPSQPVAYAGASGAMLKPSAAGSGLCLVSGGTTPNFQGWLTYVQQ